jgi:hypothetical protein
VNSCSRELRCRLVSTTYSCAGWDNRLIEGVRYSTDIPLEQADALLALYDPTEELLHFRGPKLWYTNEPSWHSHFTKHPVGRMLVKRLAPEERAWFGSALPQMRVPHYTHRGMLSTPRVAKRKTAAVAYVSNYGGRFWFLYAHFRLRNRFILEPRVELYGRISSWKLFRQFPRVWIQCPPSNYRGNSVAQPVGPVSEHQITFLSNSNVAVCLENATEPHYFTEKFVNAVRAGCVPVYHAHPTVKTKLLAGAKWVDPADFGFSPTRTLDYALAQNPAEYQTANDNWLRSGVLKDSNGSALFGKLHHIMRWKLDKNTE